ncbi:MAG: VWA domain-containing protein [Pseudomonadales bacterium]|nr:VWA domain-containing protein [Pseudomonadales bacterium]
MAALRHADVAVSPAETLDAFQVLSTIGVSDPRLLHDALSLALAKTAHEKALFSDCFERFFHQLAFQEAPRRTMIRSVSAAGVIASIERVTGEDIQKLVTSLLDGERDHLSMRVQELAQDAGVFSMRTLRDKNHVVRHIVTALHIDTLRELARVADPHRDVLNYLHHYVMGQIRHYVDEQYRLVVDASGRKALLDAALKSHLAQISPEYYAEVESVVRNLAERLSQQHRRRRKRAQRGMLDVRQMLRDNVAYNGNLFRLRWRQRKLERSRVFVLCDVSGSVSRIARFLLLFLHELSDVLPNVRTFAFSNSLGEITEFFERHDHERAIEEVLLRWGHGTTDYGRALLDFRERVAHQLNHRSTIIVLGDARSNFFDPRSDVLRDVSGRVKQVFWLNPERRDTWGEGDSEMPRYAPHCLRVERCSHLQDLNRFADTLLNATR